MADTLNQMFLEIQDACVRRKGREILRIDSFSLKIGEHIAILGPNGSGKSTFIKLITREFLPLYRETPPVLLYGQARPTLAEIKKRIGVVSASTQDQITAHFPVREIVVGGLYGTVGLPRHVKATKKDFGRAEEALEQLGVETLKDRDAMTLSTGQARRVLIARALVGKPDTLVLDEPCTGLDPEGMYAVRRNLRRLARAGIALIAVTHYPEDVVPEISRIVLLKEGHLFADGPKEDLLCDTTMSELFDAPLKVVRSGAHREYFSLVGAY